MMTMDASRCAICGARAVDRPRLTVEQDRHYDCPRLHAIGLCADHGAQLRAGTLALHQVLYDWTQKHHEELYDGTRLILAPRVTCLECNEPFATIEEHFTCPACGKVNVVGTALGHPAAVRLKTD